MVWSRESDPKHIMNKRRVRPIEKKQQCLSVKTGTKCDLSEVCAKKSENMFFNMDENRLRV
jgi:hypothetical protein